MDFSCSIYHSSYWAFFAFHVLLSRVKCVCVCVCRMRFQFRRYSNELIRFRFNLQVIQWDHTHAPLAVFPLNYSQHVLSVCVFDEGANMLLSCAGALILQWHAKPINIINFTYFISFGPFHLHHSRFFFCCCFVCSVRRSQLNFAFINIHVSSFRSCGRFTFVAYLFILLFVIFFVHVCWVGNSSNQKKKKRNWDSNSMWAMHDSRKKECVLYVLQWKWIAWVVENKGM